MFSVRLADTWRTTTFRLVLLYGAMFIVGVVSLLSLIYYHTAKYIDQQIDQVIEAELHSFQVTSAKDLQSLIARAIERDVRHIDIYGLFSPDGVFLAGNIKVIPPALHIDEPPRSVKVANGFSDRAGVISIRGVVSQISGQYLVVVGREERQIGEIRNIIINALACAAIVIAIGTIYGVWLSVVPVRRIREIQRISHKIVNGDIGLRLPVSNRNDELDMLAGIVNLMLDEIEQRMLDIKGASDSVAHNLRTPLTRLRATLNRLEDICQEGEERTCVGQAIDEVDHLLSRFRALLRISEISGSMRKAGFETVDLKSVLQKVQEVYAPLAEEKSIAFDLLLPPDPVEILGDSALLFEAILNLVDNAIKFTPPSGVVQILLEPGPVVKVVDSGPGIRQEHIKRVMQPFYRGDTSRNVPGSGVGLSIVSAIANLHGFRFDLVSSPSGTQAFLYCIHS